MKTCHDCQSGLGKPSPKNIRFRRHRLLAGLLQIGEGDLRGLLGGLLRLYSDEVERNLVLLLRPYVQACHSTVTGMATTTQASAEVSSNEETSTSNREDSGALQNAEGGTRQTRGQRYRALVQRADTDNEEWTVGQTILGLCAYMLDLNEVGAQNPQHVIEEQVTDGLLPHDDLFPIDYPQRSEYSVRVLYDVCRFYNVLNLPSSYYAVLSEENRRNERLRPHIWLAYVSHFDENRLRSWTSHLLAHFQSSEQTNS